MVGVDETYSCEVRPDYFAKIGTKWSNCRLNLTKDSVNLVTERWG